MFKTVSIVLLAVSLAVIGTGCQAGGTETVTVTKFGNQVGNIAYDFSVPDAEGNVITLSEYAGRPVLLSFWSTG